MPADRQAESLRLWVIFARAHTAVAARAQADVARHGLTIAEFGVMEALHHKGPLLLSELKAKILVSNAGVTYLVDRLEKRGLVERRRCERDRRAYYAPPPVYYAPPAQTYYAPAVPQASFSLFIPFR